MRAPPPPRGPSTAVEPGEPPFIRPCRVSSRPSRSTTPMDALAPRPVLGSHGRVRRGRGSTTRKAESQGAGWGGPNISFNRVPRGQDGQDRDHLNLGAPRPRPPTRWPSWTGLAAAGPGPAPCCLVMQDPEGNEFSVWRPARTGARVRLTAVHRDLGRAGWDLRSHEGELEPRSPLLDGGLPGTTADRGVAPASRGVQLDGLLLADGQSTVGDHFVDLGVAAEVVHPGLGLGPGIVDLVTRHPAVVAAAIASVQVECGGRAVLGVGEGSPRSPRSGWPLPRWHGCGSSSARSTATCAARRWRRASAASRIGSIAQTGLPACRWKSRDGAEDDRVRGHARGPGSVHGGRRGPRVAWATGIAQQAPRRPGWTPPG